MTSPHEPSELAGSSIQSRESTPTPLVMPRRRILENVHIQRDIQVLQRELGEDDIEELIITDGARSFASSSIPYHQDPANDDDTEEESVVDEQAVTTVARIEFLPPDQLPSWFSENIKKIYLVDRHGGALSFKELNAITRYRALVEIVHRRQWKQYLKAGEARWKLQNVLRKLKPRPLTQPFYEYRKKQFGL